jgi:redox-sensitive bicupin YhaK (pirin superfamily)
MIVPRPLQKRRFAERVVAGLLLLMNICGTEAMLTLREASGRRHIGRTGHDTWMSFDPEARKDPFREGFRGLQGFDEDRLAPGRGAPSQTRNNLEILTYVMEGVLVHEDDLGHHQVIRSGEFQLITAGSGMRHKRSNGSHLDAARMFEIRLPSDILDLVPQCAQRRFSAGDRRGVFLLVASPEAGPGTFRIQPDVRIYSSLPDRGCHLIHAIKPGRHAWLQVIRGRIQLLDLALLAGDGVAFLDEISVSITALEPSELLLFDLA